mmetsp:Transcript_30583/g.30901  ORF Transcript_30583/g.30901 Transcript_30583/m.30901 type:complete len:225 (-) Transcript_30583:235-909(-)
MRAEDAIKLHPNLVISKSKAYLGLFTKIRDVNTKPIEFAFYAKRLMRILSEDAIGELPSNPSKIETPCDPCEGVITMDPNDICAVSIVRAGDSLLEVVREILPGVHVGKILIQRNEETKDKTPEFYYSKMPPNVAGMKILLCDPMLATAGSSIMAVDVLENKHGVKAENIIFINVLCAPEGLKILASKYPSMKIVTAQVDEYLNEENFIVPGLGDFGDRFFNTT